MQCMISKATNTPKAIQTFPLYYKYLLHYCFPDLHSLFKSFTLLALLLNATHKNIKGIFKIIGLKTTDLTFKYQNGLNEMTCSSMTITEICPLTISGL